MRHTLPSTIRSPAGIPAGGCRDKTLVHLEEVFGWHEKTYEQLGRIGERLMEIGERPEEAYEHRGKLYEQRTDF